MPDNSRNKQVEDVKKGRRANSGSFKPGQSGNPAGRAQGSRTKAALLAEALVDGQAEAIVQKTIELGLAGDTTCLRILVERLCPVRRDRPIRLDMLRVEGAAGIAQGFSAVLEAVASGEVTPGEASTVAGLLDAARKAHELSEVEGRLSKVEQMLEERRRA